MRAGVTLAALAALAMGGAAGCHDSGFGRVEFTVIAADPDVSVTSDAVRLRQGQTATVVARLVDRDDATLDGTLLPANPQILDVRAAPDGRLVLLGVKSGTTSLRAVVGSDDVGAVPAEVTKP